MGKRDEPSALKFGRLFHDEVQSEWERKFDDTNEDVNREHELDGSKRRMGIPVSWHDESIEEARARHMRTS